MEKKEPFIISRRNLIQGAFIALVPIEITESAQAATPPNFTVILGRPTASKVSVSVISDVDVSAFISFGTSAKALTKKSSSLALKAGIPTIFELAGLRSSAKTYYQINYQNTGTAFSTLTASNFSTQKKSSAEFSFTVQGDTHPERAGKMFNEDLYKVTLGNIAKQTPDFHILLGDDFSIDPLISKGAATKENVEKVYKKHRDWLDIIGESTPIFLVNGNHEQAARYLLDGTETNPAVLAGNARIKYFPLPVPDDFYTGDAQEIEFVGKPRDYYSWTWGDALFVTLDPYWHSQYAVDNVAGVTNDENQTNKKSGSGASKVKDLWQVGIGNEQYEWLKKTLESSKAKYKFVFAHHVMGTGRGGVEVSYDYEWGGRDPKQTTSFKEQRPTWELPIHDLMVKHGVNIFFQGHDHIFVTQERDGVIYQSMPNPADDTFSVFNDAAYKSGTKAPNSGHVRVKVTPTKAIVEYFLAARSQDSGRKNLQIAHSYNVIPKSR